MIPNADQIARERLRHDRASRGPGFTFLCACCCQPHVITGRRKVNGKWHCKFCVAGAKHYRIREVA